MSVPEVFADPGGDAELERAMAVATASEGLVTLNQVYRAWCAARYVNTEFLGAVAVLFLLLVPTSFCLDFGPVVAVLPLAVAAMLLHRLVMAPSRDRAVFDGAILRRMATGASFDGVTLEPSLAAPDRAPEADIYSYGVSRVLVVDEDLLVDRLIDAGFHATHQVLIISTSGYPSHVRAAAVRAFEQGCDVFLVQTYRRGPAAPRPVLRVPESRIEIGVAWADLRWLASRFKPVPIDSGDISLDLLDTDALCSVLGGCIDQKCDIADLLRPVAALAGGAGHWGASDFG